MGNRALCLVVPDHGETLHPADREPSIEGWQKRRMRWNQIGHIVSSILILVPTNLHHIGSNRACPALREHTPRDENCTRFSGPNVPPRPLPAMCHHGTTILIEPSTVSMVTAHVAQVPPASYGKIIIHRSYAFVRGMVCIYHIFAVPRVSDYCIITTKCSHHTSRRPVN